MEMRSSAFFATGARTGNFLIRRRISVPQRYFKAFVFSPALRFHVVNTQFCVLSHESSLLVSRRDCQRLA
jgi:hypothetical protein